MKKGFCVAAAGGSGSSTSCDADDDEMGCRTGVRTNHDDDKIYC